MVDAERVDRLLARIAEDLRELRGYQARGSDLLGDAPVLAAVKYRFVTAIAGCARVAEQLYSARSARHYDALRADLRASFDVVAAPPDLLDRALRLQRDLAHHHGMWHRTPIPNLLIAETALHHGFGVVHVDRDYARIAEVRPLTNRRLG